jgi:hypothetical protein
MSVTFRDLQSTRPSRLPRERDRTENRNLCWPALLRELSYAAFKLRAIVLPRMFAQVGAPQPVSLLCNRFNRSFC